MSENDSSDWLLGQSLRRNETEPTPVFVIWNQKRDAAKQKLFEIDFYARQQKEEENFEIGLCL